MRTQTGCSDRHAGVAWTWRGWSDRHSLPPGVVLPSTHARPVGHAGPEDGNVQKNIKLCYGKVSNLTW